MVRTLKEIEQILREEGAVKAHEELEKFLEKEPQNAQAWYLLGGIYRREQQWGEAINALNRAKFLDPAGPAAHAIEHIYEILRFQNTDLMNP
ncbi:MAG: tetratricopeptide repeat protein [Bacteroidales bacterium]